VYVEILVKVVYIGIGGFVGATCRYGMSGLVYRILGVDFPFGTLFVNIVGSFILGFILQMHSEYLVFNENVRVGLCIGVLGAFTTFSTFSYETYCLVRDGEIFRAGINIFSNVLLCLVAVWLGIVGVKLITGRV
jgi:CrcB protein